MKDKKRKTSFVVAVVVLSLAVMGSWYFGYRSGWDDGYKGYEARVGHLIKDMQERQLEAVEPKIRKPVRPRPEYPMHRMRIQRPRVS